jgi:hypothetical protein
MSNKLNKLENQNPVLNLDDHDNEIIYNIIILRRILSLNFLLINFPKELIFYINYLYVSICFQNECKLLICVNKRKYYIKINKKDKIEQLAHLISQKEGFSIVKSFYLIHGSQLDYDKTIEYYGLENHSTITVIYRCIGD